MVQAHRLKGAALARVAAAEQLVELKPHYLDGGKQRLQAHHEDIAQQKAIVDAVEKDKHKWLSQWNTAMEG